jgi:CRP-like cAMP-binding protein
MESLEPILKQHAFFRELPPQYFDLMLGCTTHVVFKAGEVILREGESADKFYLVRSGKIAIYMEKPQEITIQTIKEGDILGWSWLVEPYRNRFSAKAVENTWALALDGKCLREKCEKNSDLGYQLLKRLVNVFVERLEATRLQVINMYNINVDNR